MYLLDIRFQILKPLRKEKTADAILISNGPLLQWQKSGKNPGVPGEKVLPNRDDRNLDQFWVFQWKESGIKGSK